MNTKVAKAMKLTLIQAKEERERAIKMTIPKYLAFDAFKIVKAECFLEGFEAFWEMATKAFLDCDFSTFVLDEEEEGDEEGAEGKEGGKEVEGVARGMAEIVGAAASRDATSGDVNPHM